MNQLSTEPTMTVKTIAKILNITEKTVLKSVKNLYPDIVKNGKTTYLSEYQVTRIKEQIFKNVYLDHSVEVTTDIEMSEMVLKVVGYHTEKIRTLENKVEKAEEQIKLLVHDFNKLYTTTEIAKESNMKSAQELNTRLEELKIQYKQNNTWVLYSSYSNNNYTSLKETVLDNGKVIYSRMWTGMGRQFILNLIQESN